MVNHKACFVSGIFMAIIGTVLFVLSFALLPALITTATNNGVIEAIIVDSPDSTRYNDWIGQQSIQNYYQQYFYAWNLTNPSEVLLGKPAIYENIGPFNYKYEFEFSNVSFMDDGNLATYTQTKTYIYQPDMSPNDPEKVMITNFNPAYLGLMYQLAPNSAQLGISAEELLFAIGSCGQMKVFIDYLSSDNFTNIAYFTQNPSLYLKQFEVLLKTTEINGNLEMYYQEWANSTSDTSSNSQLWNGMLVSKLYGYPSNITMESALMLFNSTNENSILNQKIGQTLWINAMLGDSASITLLETALNLSSDQINIILNWWLNDFTKIYTDSYLMRICGIPNQGYTDLSLLGVCQFISAIPTNGKSIANYTFINQEFNQGPIEIPLNTGFTLSMSTITAYDNLFNELNPNSILNLNGMVSFINAAKSLNVKAYNISILDGGKILEYATLKLVDTYTFTSIQKLYAENGGLIVTRSVDEWLWTCNDNILNFLGVDQPCALQQNNTVNKPSTVFTGKDDLSMTNVMFEYQEQTELTIWNNPVPVSGFTESGQFPPLQSSVPSTMTLFEENVIRPVQLELAGDSQISGIDTKRYYLQNNSFPASETFKTTIPGFANLTDIQNLPIYVSLWDMWEVPAQYSSDYIIGLNQTYLSAQIPLDLEPITGNALYYNLKLQINLAIPEGSDWFAESSIYKYMPNNRYFPSIKIGQTATPSDDNINLIKSQFKLIKILNIAPMVVISIIGGIILLVGIIMIVFGFRKMKLQKEQGYKAIINDE